MEVGVRVLLVFLAAEDAGTPSSEALLEALRGALVKDVQVLPQTEAEAAHGTFEEQAQLREARANVRWGKNRSWALVRIKTAEPVRDIQRRIEFAPQDDERERGRTVGLALAAMIPEWAVTSSEPPPPLSQAADNALSTLPTDDPPRWSLALLADGQLGAASAGVGATADLRRRLGDRVALRVAGAWRAGPVTGLEGRSSFASVSFGPVWRLWGGAELGELGLRLRTELLAEHLQVSRSGTSGPEAQSRWLPAADALLECVYSLSLRWRLVGVGGARVAWPKRQRWSACGRSRGWTSPARGRPHEPISPSIRAASRGTRRSRFWSSSGEPSPQGLGKLPLRDGSSRLQQPIPFRAARST
jgi:hypothetical protein